MFTKSIRLFIAAALWSAGSFAIAQSGIPVYLEPNAASTPVATLDPNQSGAIDSLPVMDDEKAQEGWMFTEYFGTFVGFVDPGSVRKDLSLTDNVPAFLRPDRNSPVLALIQDTDETNVIRVGTDWAEVEFKKLVPVYYQDPAFLASLQPDPVIIPGPQPDEPDLISADPDTPVQVDPVSRTTDPGTPIEELEPIRTSPEPRETLPPVLSSGEDDQTPTAPRGAPAVDVPRSIQGKLQRASRIFGFKPKFQYEIRTGTNDRLAWIDLSDVLVSSLATYMDKEVIIYGEFREVDGSNQPLMVARTIQLR